MTTTTAIGFEDLLDLIGYRPGDNIVVGSSTTPDDYRECVIALADAQVTVNRHVGAGRNVWHSVNPPGASLGSTGRGTEATFTRINALYADLDLDTEMKPGGFRDIETCEAVITLVSEHLGQRPVAVVYSGHGAQPYWALEASETDELPADKAMALIRAFGGLVYGAAEEIQPGVTVDGVFDLARILRAPGTINFKDRAHPAVTTASARGGAPLGVEEVIDRLREFGIELDDYLNEGTGDVISPPEDWVWNEVSGCRWTPAMIKGWATDTPEKRHNWMVSKKVKIECARRRGCFASQADYLAAQAALDTRFAQLRKPGRYELIGAQKWAIDKVSRFTDEKVRSELKDHKHNDDADTVIDEDAFWRQRDSLKRIHQYAQACMVGPWGVLGAVLVRVICQIPPEVRLPRIIGSPMSLNMSLALVGTSGQGKDGCDGCARDAIRFGEFDQTIAELPLGSGEGVTKSLMPDSDGKQEPVLFIESEIDNAAALFERSSATLESTLRKMYCGQQLGYTNAQKSTKSLVHAHTYRCGLIVGVQPTRGDALLNGTEGGTPQRFLWLPVLDPQAPDETPEVPPRWLVKIPPLFDNTNMVDGQHVHLAIPDEIVTTIRDHRRAVLRGLAADPLDGHKLLSRLKVAVALMFLDGDRKEVGLDDWELAGQIMAVSDRTRQDVIDARNALASQANKSRAYATDEREEFVADRKVARAREAILRKLAGGKWFSGADLYREAKSDIRDQIHPAIAELVEAGLISEVLSGNTIGYENVP